MCIYCNTNNYRKIYENHYGQIPKESDGRSYEIHHQDGNHSNNSPDNLIALTLQEHYDIHYAQGDYGACYYMAIQRMNKTVKELSDLSSKIQSSRVANGTHHFQIRSDGSSMSSDRVANGTHHFQIRSDGSSMSSDRVKTGTHNWLDGKTQSAYQKQLVETKNHNFQNPNFVNSSQIYLSCLCCKKVTNLRGFKQGHLNKCYKSDLE